MSAVLLAGGVEAGGPTSSIQHGKARSDDLRLFEDMLLDPSVPASFRQEAALRLIRIGSE